MTSRFYKVCDTDLSQPAPSTIKDICYKDRHLSTPAIRWGVRNEKNAKAAYCKKMSAHVNFSMRDFEFVIHSGYPEIGASPDGIIRCDCCGEGSLEVKCPLSVRAEDLLNMKEGATCLTKDENGKAPKKGTHLLLPDEMPAVCVWPHLCRLCCLNSEVLSLRAGCQRRSFVRGNVAQSPPFLPSTCAIRAAWQLLHTSTSGWLSSERGQCGQQ